jgi:Phage terminase large subunit
VSNVNARLLLGRKALPDLKDTIFSKILEHLEGSFQEGVDYTVNETQARILFRNGSEIISRSWSDKKYKKLRSLELSAAIIEELTENNDEDKQAYDEIKMRVGRLPHIRKSFIICATNPDSPAHWVYNYFIGTPHSDTRHVYYSVTTDNPFLPESYIRQLKEELDPKMARRMIYGEWIEIEQEVIYYAYSKDRNFTAKEYEIDQRFPIHISWDFNIAENKPLSLVLFQFIDDAFHFFDEVVIHGIRTEDSLDELANRGLLDHKCLYIVNGDATGKHRDTRNIHSDYDIIKKYLSNYRNPSGEAIKFQLEVPTANPAIRSRHNIVNAYCYNELKRVRLYVYKKAKTMDQGMRLTQLKKGGDYVEDDSKPFQHITTAAGYGIYFEHIKKTRKQQATIQL